MAVGMHTAAFQQLTEMISALSDKVEAVSGSVEAVSDKVETVSGSVAVLRAERLYGPSHAPSSSTSYAQFWETRKHQCTENPLFVTPGTVRKALLDCILKACAGSAYDSVTENAFLADLLPHLQNLLVKCHKMALVDTHSCPYLGDKKLLPDITIAAADTTTAAMQTCHALGFIEAKAHGVSVCSGTVLGQLRSYADAVFSVPSLLSRVFVACINPTSMLFLLVDRSGQTTSSGCLALEVGLLRLRTMIDKVASDNTNTIQLAKSCKNYRLLHILGSGASANVYSAHPIVDRAVQHTVFHAVKVFTDERLTTAEVTNITKARVAAAGELRISVVLCTPTACHACT
jgi:hypothetical protein